MSGQINQSTAATANHGFSPMNGNRSPYAWEMPQNNTSMPQEAHQQPTMFPAVNPWSAPPPYSSVEEPTMQYSTMIPAPQRPASAPGSSNWVFAAMNPLPAIPESQNSPANQMARSFGIPAGAPTRQVTQSPFQSPGLVPLSPQTRQDVQSSYAPRPHQDVQSSYAPQSLQDIQSSYTPPMSPVTGPTSMDESNLQASNGDTPPPSYPPLVEQLNHHTTLTGRYKSLWETMMEVTNGGSQYEVYKARLNRYGRMVRLNQALGIVEGQLAASMEKMVEMAAFGRE